MTLHPAVAEALAPLRDRFWHLDHQTHAHLQRVLRAFADHRVSVSHFAGTTGYGHDDLGREVLDRVFAQIVEAPAAIVRGQLVSGTHAITCALFGVLRPGDELLAVAGTPYDTLEPVLGLRGAGAGSLRDFGVTYRQLELTAAGTVDWETLATAVQPQTKMVLIQRSRGYAWRPSLTVADIARIVRTVKAQNPEVVCFVDNCYGEFVEAQEPTAVGVDLMAGSWIKNPGGTLVPYGGYLAGRADLVEAAANRLTAPGIGSHGGASENRRLQFQGLFLAPQMVGETLKGLMLAAQFFAQRGYAVQPGPFDVRSDTIQALRLGSAAALQAFCHQIQRCSPVDAFVAPVPAVTPGYDSPLVMAGGTFVDGSTAELSADGPLREPYTVYCQGGTHWTHMALVLAAFADQAP
ncbi:MAG: aluminum resistance family protein [Oscillatoriales cyanobacterium SM2_1_8]|nr:aluminum resistance family protein [Oscillatoriales cyanobacterium SM2_1_8]